MIANYYIESYATMKNLRSIKNQAHIVWYKRENKYTDEGKAKACYYREKLESESKFVLLII